MLLSKLQGKVKALTIACLPQGKLRRVSAQDGQGGEQQGGAPPSCSMDGLPRLPEFELWLQDEPGKRGPARGGGAQSQQAVAAAQLRSTSDVRAPHGSTQSQSSGASLLASCSFWYLVRQAQGWTIESSPPPALISCPLTCFLLASANHCGEGGCSTSCEVRERGREQEHLQGASADSSGSAEGTWANEQYEEDAAFSKYARRLQRCPGQCLRMSAAGNILWPRKDLPTPPRYATRCNNALGGCCFGTD